jgi:hypothetical protein
MRTGIIIIIIIIISIITWEFDRTRGRFIETSMLLMMSLSPS